MLKIALFRKDLRKVKFQKSGDGEISTRGWFHRWITIKVPHIIDLGVIGPAEDKSKLKRHFYTQEYRALIEDRDGFMHEVESQFMKFLPI